MPSGHTWLTRGSTWQPDPSLTGGPAVVNGGAPPLTGGGIDDGASDNWQAMWHHSGGDTWPSNDWCTRYCAGGGWTNHELTCGTWRLSEDSVRGAGGQISVQGSRRGQYKVSIPKPSRWTCGMI
nr:hypothetical protein [Tanacetum cinerariifolium]